MSKYRLINAECENVIPTLSEAVLGFVDVPDNIGLKYASYKDKIPHDLYLKWVGDVVWKLMGRTKIFWISFNAKYTLDFGSLFLNLSKSWNCLQDTKWLPIKPAVQIFTFGQHNHYDLGNNHRPLWRFTREDATLYPDQIRIPSWRLLNGDKRADPRGRVPGDVFDFPRVTGNSKQRCTWCPTQLHEDLVARCILMATQEGDRVLDPCAGTGTTLRVCKRLKRNCTLIEYDGSYCRTIAKENGLRAYDGETRLDYPEWRL